ncbi:MAG: L-threonine 3-dehydrogenase [Chlamydiia bacterium]|nr:L-threonine 3-dehydrogenase [Chlamydiia bacterium]
MKAIVKKEAARGLVMTDVPEPTPGIGEVKIRPLITSVCGTDLHIYKWDEWAAQTIRTPQIIGHEFVGVVEEVGPGANGVKVGQRIVGEGHFTCGVCRNCREGNRHLCSKTEGLGVQRPGCFAEHFCLPAENLFPIPDTVPNEVAAIFDPFGNAVHTALEFNPLGEDVLITGAGPIGLMATLVVRHAGARSITVTDVSPHRLEMAKKFGATRLVNVAEQSLESVCGVEGKRDIFGIGLEMSGVASALNSMLRVMRPGGSIALLGILPDGIGICWSDVIFRSLTLRGIYGRKIFKTWYQMSHLIEGGLDLSPVITHRFAADDFESAFQTMLEGRCGKVLLDWTGSAQS